MYKKKYIYIDACFSLRFQADKLEACTSGRMQLMRKPRIWALFKFPNQLVTYHGICFALAWEPTPLGEALARTCCRICRICSNCSPRKGSRTTIAWFPRFTDLQESSRHVLATVCVLWGVSCPWLVVRCAGSGCLPQRQLRVATAAFVGRKGPKSVVKSTDVKRRSHLEIDAKTSCWDFKLRFWRECIVA